LGQQLSLMMGRIVPIADGRRHAKLSFNGG
jgi:hypothetical protein